MVSHTSDAILRLIRCGFRLDRAAAPLRLASRRYRSNKCRKGSANALRFAAVLRLRTHGVAGGAGMTAFVACRSHI
jgi:hypothetical protein